MILFSPAKINIGLQIIERRKDGYHNLQSIMFPLGLCDILEIRRFSGPGENIRFSQSGIWFDSQDEKNLCIQAWKLFSMEAPLPPVEMHLHKQIPVGAGLGGGSSDATATLRGLNKLTNEPLSEEKLHELAARLGSDCPFFLHGKPMMMEGRGDILSPVSLQLNEFYLLLLFPEIHVSTAEAYAGVIPAIPEIHLRDLIREPVNQWIDLVENDFERSVFKKYPELDQIKQGLYQAGAIYASLSGSGSSLYGIFKEKPVLQHELKRYVIWQGKGAYSTATI